MEEAVDLLSELDGDEHDWIDFKENYYVGGIANNTAEFIRDVSSIANSVPLDEEGYIFVGVDDEGNAVGVAEDCREQYDDGPRHIFSHDESDIQEIVDSNLEPAPSFSFHTYNRDDTEFGSLVIYPVQQAPSMVAQDINNSDGMRLLHRGLIYVRKGSGKKIAAHEDMEQIIRMRINKERDNILDNVGKIVSLGPDAIERLGTQASSGGLSVIPSEDAEIEVQERLTREPASSLDEELNGDIANWVNRGELLTKKAIWEYYANPDDLTLDDEAIRFLCLSSIENNVRGLFWLHYVDDHELVDTLLDAPNTYHTTERAASVLFLAGDSDGFDRLLEAKDTTAKYDPLNTYANQIDRPVDERVDQVVASYTHELRWNNWSDQFDIDQMDESEIVDQIKGIADVLAEMYNVADENRSVLWRAKEIRDGLGDLEIGLARFLFSAE